MKKIKPMLFFLATCLLSCALTNSALDAANVENDLLDTHRMVRLSGDDPNGEGLDVPVSLPDSISVESASSITDFHALYVLGAKVAKVYGVNDVGYRMLSVKIYSMRDSHYLINMIGIVDITEGDIGTPTLPKFISVLSRGTTYFRMVAGGREYAFELSSDGSILLKRINARHGEDGALSTSLRELTMARNMQIMQGAPVAIGGIPYYALGQGGGKGSLLFFPKVEVDRNPSGDSHPELMGDVAQVLSDHSTARISGHPKLGSLRNGDEFHLEFGNDGLWHVRPGAGNTGD